MNATRLYPERIFIICVLVGLSVFSLLADDALGQQTGAGSHPGAFGFYKHTAPTGDDANRADLSSGIATYSIPIEVPPGTGGTQPVLELVYNSRTKYGNAGKGWTIELPKITRNVRYGSDKAQICGNIYCANGTLTQYSYAGDDLIFAGTYRSDPFGCLAARYLRRVHRHEMILFCSGTGASHAMDGRSDYWTVISKDGTWASFGRKKDTQNSALLGPKWFGQDQRILEYYLDETRSAKGLGWRASYTVFDNGTDNTVPHLQSIQYAFRIDSGTAVGALRSIEFEWEIRPDAGVERVEFKYGMALLHDERLKRIDVRIADTTIRSYQLAYDADPHTPGEQYGSQGSASMLWRVQLLDGFGDPHLAAHTFTYYDRELGFASTLSNAQPLPNDEGLEHQRTDGIDQILVDMTGDGYLDLLVANRTCCDANGSLFYDWQIYKGDGAGGFMSPADWIGAPDELIQRFHQRASPHGDPDVSMVTGLIDLDGDGLLDWYAGNFSTKYLKNIQYGFTEQSLSWLNPPVEFESHRKNARNQDTVISKLTDMNGDACPDHLYSQNGAWWWDRNRMCDAGPTGGPIDYSFDFPRLWIWWEDSSAVSAEVPYLERIEELPPGEYPIGDGWTLRRSERTYFHKTQLADLNGDGLVDLYHNTGAQGTVYFGTGRGFIKNGGSHFSYANDITNTYSGINYFSSGVTHGLTVSEVETEGDLYRRQTKGWLDVDGDGLKDLVIGYWSSNWDVLLNTGTGLSPPVQLAGIPGSGIQYSAPYSGGGNTVRTEQRVIDYDGAGLPSIVRYHQQPGVPSSATIIYRRPVTATAGAGLLATASNGRGAVTEFTYKSYLEPTGSHSLHFPITVLASIEIRSSIEDEVSFSTAYRYDEPFFDRDERVFRGFGSVESTVRRNAADGSTIVRFDRYRFHVGEMWRETLDPRSGERIYDAPELAGYPIAVESGPSPDDIRSERWSVWRRFPHAAVGQTVWSVGLDTARHYDIKSLQFERRDITYGYDSYGNATSIMYSGGWYNVLDDVTVLVNFRYNTPDYIVGLPWQVRVCGGADLSCTNLLREKQFFYDACNCSVPTQGNVVLSYERLLYGTLDRWTHWSYSYDEYGNPVQIVAPEGDITRIDYAGPEFIYPEAITAPIVKHDDPLEIGPDIELEMTMEWGDLLDRPVHVWDQNGRFFLYEYDTFGRLELVWSSSPEQVVAPNTVLPEQELNLLHWTQYSDGEVLGANSIKTTSYDGNVRDIVSLKYYDGFGQNVQEKWSTESGTYTAVSRRFDPFGLVDRESLPYSTDSLEFSAYDLSAATPPSDLVVEEHDWAGRTVRSYLSADCGGGECKHYESVTTYSTRDVPDLWSIRVESLDPSIPGAKQYHYDGFGRITGVDELSRSASGDLDVKASIALAYDRVGNLTSYSDADGTSTAMTYDSRGLQRTLTEQNVSNCAEPELCRYHSIYDDNGRLIWTIDTTGRTIRYRLDELGRVYYKDFCGNGNYACPPWNYDNLYVYDGPGPGGTGRLWRGHQLGQLGPYWSLSYDAWGRVRQNTRKSFDKTFSTGWEYDHLGRTTSIFYPSSSGTREVRYTYEGGQVKSVFWSSSSPGDAADQYLVENITYDYMNRPEVISWGNGLETRSIYNDSNTPNRIPGRQKLDAYEIFDGASNAALRRESYAYYDDGNIRSVEGPLSGPEEEVTDYEYDYSGRVSRVKLSKGGTVLEDKQYRYSLSGNLDRIWNEVLPFESWTYSYSNVNAGPNAVTSIEFGDSTKPWQQRETEFTPRYSNMNYLFLNVMGFHFEVATSTVLSQLCGFFNTATTVKLWDQGTGAVLRSAEINSANDWECAPVQPLELSPKASYTVAAVGLEGHVVTERRNLTFPVTSGSVSITGSTYCYDASTSSVPCAPGQRPVNNVSYRMYGMVDIGVGSEQQFFSYNGRGEVTSKWPAVGANSAYFYNLDRRLYRVAGPCLASGGYFDTYIYTDAAASRALRYSPPSCGEISDMTYYFGPHFGVSREDVGGPNDTSYEEAYVWLAGRKVAFLTQRQPGKIFYLHEDEIDSITFSTTESGDEFSHQSYSTFGQESTRGGGDAGLRYGYTGQELDKRARQLHLGTREYEPSVRRWFVPDAIVPNLFSPQELNRYSYVSNDPVNHVDPSGRAAINVDPIYVEGDPEGSTGTQGSGTKDDPFRGVCSNASPGCSGSDGGSVSLEHRVGNTITPGILTGRGPGRGGGPAAGRGYDPSAVAPVLGQTGATGTPGVGGTIFELFLPVEARAYSRGAAVGIGDPLQRFHAQLGTGLRLGSATLGNRAIGWSYGVTDLVLGTTMVGGLAVGTLPAPGVAIAGPGTMFLEAGLPTGVRTILVDTATRQVFVGAGNQVLHLEVFQAAGLGQHMGVIGAIGRFTAGQLVSYELAMGTFAGTQAEVGIALTILGSITGAR